MKISIVIPVYNAEKTIKRLLDSIDAQTYKNYEIIIINDGSTDKTEEILLKNKTNKIKIISKKNEGVGKARKIGYENVTGDLVFFCDSDDYLYDNYVLEKINNKFTNNNIDILMFDVLDITKNDKKVVNCFSNKVEPGLHNINEINNYFLFGPLFLKVFRKDKLTKDCFVEFNNFEDTYTTYKCLNHCTNFYYENDIYYIFDETANSKSLTKIKDIDKFIKTIDLIKMIYKESKLKESCCISTFNYYLYLINLIKEYPEWNKDKVKILKEKMNELEYIFTNNFNLIIDKFAPDKIKKYINYKYNENNKKIIFVDGMSTTGKSTISDKINNYFVENDIKVKWLHEESINNINLNLNLPKHEEIELQKLKFEMKNLFDRWKEFYNIIKNDSNTYIIDSNFSKNIHDFMLFSELNKNEIKEYYNTLIDLYEKEKIYFIFLKRDNIKESFESAYKNRGAFWEKHYKKHLDEKTRTFSEYDKEDKIYRYEKIYQDFIESIFKQFNIDKISINTEEEKWNEYINFILNKIGLVYLNKTEKEYDYNKYIGKYSCENWDIEIYYDKNLNKLILNAFWPNIQLEYIKDNTFKLDKFPLLMHFNNNKIIFTGELVWDMKNKFFEKKGKKVLKKINSGN